MDLSVLGFRVNHGENGRPAYYPGDLLKLFLYGYLNRIRSSRALERECSRNIELMWLLKRLVPDHNTVSNFRRDHPAAIKEVFWSSVRLAQYFELIGGKLIAGDSTKLRAQNSKKNNYNAKKIARHLEYIETKLSDYIRTSADVGLIFTAYLLRRFFALIPQNRLKAYLGKLCPLFSGIFTPYKAFRTILPKSVILFILKPTYFSMT